MKRKDKFDADIGSASLSTDEPLHRDKFGDWIRQLLADRGPDILRSKGILACCDEPCRFVFQAVHILLDGDL
jgi:G3E family GTPase